MSGKRKKEKRQAGFNPEEIFKALDLLESERHISKQFMLERIVQALTAAYKKDHSQVDNVIVKVDEAHHDLRMFVQKTVADEETFTDPDNQILLQDARRMSIHCEVGSVVNIPVDTVEFGRIAAGNGKQVIIQGLREAERGMVYDEFNSKQHEILTGTVTRIDPRNGNVSLHIGAGAETTEALLALGEQVEGETLEEGMRVRVYVVEVRRSTRGPQVLVSRTHPGLVKRLFEMEVPEIYDGTVYIHSIAREAGSRTKIAVGSTDPNVDAIGACIGPRKQRVDAIVEELRGEKIDIIRYNEDPAGFIAEALAPAEVLKVQMLEDGKSCRCVVPDSQLSLAIGKEGQNVRLAARLTGCKIDIKPLSASEDVPAPIPTDNSVPTDNVSTDDSVPADVSIPTDDSVPADDNVPVDDSVPADSGQLQQQEGSCHAES